MSHEDVFRCFQEQLKELEEAAVLRKSDVQPLFHDDIKSLQGFLSQVEVKLNHVEQCVGEEIEAIKVLDRKIADANKQQKCLQDMEAACLDTIPAVPSSVVAVESPSHPQVVESNAGFITQGELDEISPYMKGRLTVERINAALEELTRHATKNAAMIGAARKNKTSGIDRKHAMWLLHNIYRNPSVKEKKFFVLESDLRHGKNLKMDNSSKSILTILRHLGRISENRIHADGETYIVYICLYM
jgi:hypothetical protein